ncbi:arabinose-5-phosphate isomerase [Phorcysia thermohydrogeniphila]|uniref:Arabinose-5-phosphate isomerase n=1 Tax=Phorcysia thermohydrogeniphila TaxID=936138 RepID=A0A4R1GEV0_9BACT|nr:KpsF/GutQ family sugar-phosphate isomerase [Phorcysia thermohydrogeniphila]TCK05371.1 arabinose-5-phosphate isomerase [Phorcysia thermohydrogeniphila]
MDIVDEARRVILQEAEALKKLAQGLDDSFVKAVDILLKTKGRVVLTGVGKSGLICKKIAATLASTGTPAFFLHPADAAHGDLGMVRGDDTVIAVSNSGETAELLNVVPIIKSFGIPVIAVTNNPNSSLAKLADVTLLLHVEKEACPLGLAPTTSTTATLALGDAIAAVLMKLKGFTSQDFAKFHPGGKLGIRLSRVKDLMRTGDEIPAVSPDTALKDVIYEISSKKLGATLVLDGGKLVGIITDGDLRRAFERGVDFSTRAEEIMTKNPKTVEEDVFAEKAIEIMERYKITVLPVVGRDREVRGIIHLHDILGRRIV